MFEEQQQIGHATGPALLDKRALHREPGRVRHDTQPPHFEWAHYSVQFSIFFLTCCMN